MSPWASAMNEHLSEMGPFPCHPAGEAGILDKTEREKEQTRSSFDRINCAEKVTVLNQKVKMLTYEVSKLV